MSEHKRARLKIFMGYAAGVGKTYRMLEEAQQRKTEGVDIVIGYFEPHGRMETIAKTQGLEFVPRKKIWYRGSLFEEMDTAAILGRRPALCVVDEFAHTNVPGSERAKRWEEVEALLDAGIGVMTTMNIQHLESLNDQVFRISGIRVRETVPDWVVQQAEEVVMVDLTPRALMHRLERGVVYAPEKAERALQNFFQESTLAALRELTMRQTAHEVVQRIESVAERPSKRHRILVWITEDPKTAMLIRRAKRVGDFLGADCFALYVKPPKGTTSRTDSEAIERHLNFAHNLRIETRVLEGGDVAHTLVDFGRLNRVTQIYLTRPRRGSWFHFLNEDPAQKIISLAKDMQIVIVSDREHQSK